MTVRPGAILFALSLVASLPQWGYCRDALPPWVSEEYRLRSYPPGVWYVGFARDVLPRGADISAALKRLERSAQVQLVESIALRVSGSGSVKSTGEARQRGAHFDERISARYTETIEVSSGADIAGMEIRSHHDAKSRRVYAFAAVKRSDVAAYYARLAEALLQKAEEDLEAGMVAAAGDGLDACDGYLSMLGVVGDGGEARRLRSRAAAIRKSLRDARAEIDGEGVYVAAKETIGGQAVSIAARELMGVLSGRRYRVITDSLEARYHLRVEIYDCESVRDGGLYGGRACVNACLTDVKTGREERVSGKSERGNGNDPQTASERAFRKVTAEFWTELMKNTGLFR